MTSLQSALVASPVYVCLHVPWEVIVHNVGQASSDVQASGCHICGHHDLRLARPEVQKCSLQQTDTWGGHSITVPELQHNILRYGSSSYLNCWT